MKKALLLVSILLFYHLGMAQENQRIEGRTLDGVTGNALPFVSIVLKESGRGIVSNDRGNFVLSVTDQMLQDSVLFSCIGYEMARVPVNSWFNSPLDIKLQPKTFELEEVVIFPLSPEEYIRKAVEKIPDNYASGPSLSTGYYSELVSENNQFLKFEEAVTDTWVPAIGESATAHTSVIYARQAKDLVELQFMRSQRERKAAKQFKKDVKRGKMAEDAELSEEVNDEIVAANFGGPSQVLASDPSRNHENFMKPDLFHKFDYSFEPQVAYGHKKLMVIAFEQRKQIEQTKAKGRVYIDMDSDAIVAVEYTGTFSIPVALKPVLFAMGYGIKDPTYNAMVHYREHDGRWYVYSVHRDIQVEMTKKYMWRKNESAIFDIEQVYTVHELNTTSPKHIEENRRMTGNKTMSEQAQFKDDGFWETYTTVRPQKLAYYLDE